MLYTYYCSLYYLLHIMPPKRLASSPASGKEPMRQKNAMTALEDRIIIIIIIMVIFKCYFSGELIALS